MVLLNEYVGHMLIGTPLERPTRVLRGLTGIWQQWLHPELKELYVESRRMEQVIKRAVKDPMNCVDVGSHLGTMINIIQHSSPNGKHIAVEPVPHKVDWLKRKYPDVEVLQIALSDQETEADFFLQINSSALSGLRPYGTDEEKSQRIRVKCMRLDDIVPQERPIGFMKVVAEGAELAVMRGGEQLIQRCHPVILFDCIMIEIERFGLVPKDFYDFLVQKHSYSVFLLKDWLGNQEPLSLEAFEAAMRYPFQAFRFVATYNGNN
ncbi:FkbM family methyltransferase [Fortiea contorta]|uniref:FkbM family methyltransferase n=1 Tax=Fortiea contorta TaxID=1892405 RepID=UPI000346BF49|nr:FkbM family methyltransferase [Fortiea contorta]